MFNRVLFVLVTAFFVTMNVLLWRSEFRGENELGSGVPGEVVLQRMLTAPDNSNLEIRHRGKRIGFARWSANVGEEIATGRRMEIGEERLEGRINQLSMFTLDCDGEVFAGSLTNRYRFYVGAEFDTNSNWARFTVRVSQRPFNWGIRANAEEQIIVMSYTGANGIPFEQKFKFSEFEDPEKMFRAMGLPFAGQLLSGALAGMKLESKNVNYRQLASTIAWKANNDHLKFHGARARVYRLTFTFFERHEIVVVVSRVGEIFKVTMPFDITLVNEELKP